MKASSPKVSWPRHCSLPLQRRPRNSRRRCNAVTGHTRWRPVRDNRLAQSRRRLKRAALRSVSASTNCEHMRSSTGASRRPGDNTIWTSARALTALTSRDHGGPTRARVHAILAQRRTGGKPRATTGRAVIRSVQHEGLLRQGAVAPDQLVELFFTGAGFDQRIDRGLELQRGSTIEKDFLACELVHDLVATSPRCIAGRSNSSVATAVAEVEL